MPRLSVDPDLAFTDHRAPRDAALTRINDSLGAAADRLNAHRFIVREQATNDAGDTKLHVRRGNSEVKVEVNFVLRGTMQAALALALLATAKVLNQRRAIRASMTAHCRVQHLLGIGAGRLSPR